MNKLIIFALAFCLGAIIVYAALGDPFKFNDSSGNPTVQVGGDEGIVNATGSVHTKSHLIIEQGNKTCLDGQGCTSYIYNNGTGVVIK